MKMLDLFSGIGGASEYFRDNGWEVVRVDNNERFNPDICIDVQELQVCAGTYDFIWASPPCTEFTKYRLPWFPDIKPDMTLIKKAIEIIRLAAPKYWVIENVQGAVPFFNPLLGSVWKRIGPFYLWSNLPILDVITKHKKSRISFRNPELRAKIPYELSKGIYKAIECLS